MPFPEQAGLCGTARKRTLTWSGFDRILRAAVKYDFPVKILFWGNVDAGTVNFSIDAKQSCVYVADLVNDVIYVLNRQNLTELTRAGFRRR